MTNTPITVDEAKDFLAANPTVEWIDIFTFDLNGIARGKRFRRDDLLDLAKGGLMMPASAFIIDPRGNSIGETGRLWETGDPDVPARILSGTLAPVLVNGATHAQAVMNLETEGDMDGRAVLAGQIARLKKQGLTPVVAVELEFYVTLPGKDGAFTLEPPPGMTTDPDAAGTYEFADMDALQPFIDDIYRIATAQGLPVDAVMQESGPAQFEINLKHKDDAVAAALDGLLLKRAVKAAAREHKLNATFMAKPHHDWCGSGMHVHLSLVDKTGANAFAGKPISPIFRHAIGGLSETMADFMAIWAQYANSYRRYVPKSYVAMTPQWGFNNRTVALRIPAGNGAATRIEHRVAGADANPYLVVAAVLAGIAHGLKTKADPGAHAEGDAEEIDAPSTLPTAWVNALEVFERSTVVREAFGTGFHDVYTRLKQTERANFERIVTSLDHLWYALVA
ncbi:glutamine synthetase family protein [Hyphomicrobium sp.]|uniref:glutamine synthetase family protein n=1 Tax=Hyphomicrobium sp. TaxID=82 RepID=UPI0025B7EE91|nr:glutamine synthetase family protein [Hyphomicrobium sp.]MCC7251652.1 glutamine synthetase [Hyphomicrobium sp.]